MPEKDPTKPKPPTSPKNPPTLPPDKGDLEEAGLPGDPTTDAPPPPPKKDDEE